MPTSSRSAFYYLLIDGTDAVDSVAFGTRLQALAPASAAAGQPEWRNLLELLVPDPAEPARLVDPRHPYLPLYKLRRTSSAGNAPAVPDPAGVGVVCPGGTNSLGQDPMWREYKDPSGSPVVRFRDPGAGEDFRLVGRHAAAELSARAVTPIMLQPAVEIIGTRRQIASDYAPDGQNPVYRASLLYISSHGWLGGFSMGNAIRDWNDARPVPPVYAPADDGGTVPVGDDPRNMFWPQRKYFVIGQMDALGQAFFGPEWIILAQCSTVNDATHAMWARVLARSFPQVRGVLGYEEASPAAYASISIADTFVDRLQRGETFFEAWKAANHGQNWAAIIHKDALGDTLSNFAKRPPLRGQTTQSYLGGASRAPKLAPVSDPPAPFFVRVFNETAADPGARGEVTPATLDHPTAELAAGTRYRVVIELPGGVISQIKFQWIHIRDTFKQFALASLFKNIYVDGRPDARLDLSDPKTVKLTLAPTDSAVSICFEAQDHQKLDTSGLEAAHSYIWPRVYLSGTFAGSTRPASDVKYDFKDRGLLY